MSEQSIADISDGVARRSQSNVVAGSLAEEHVHFIEHLARAILAVKPLVTVLGETVRVAPLKDGGLEKSDGDDIQLLLNNITVRLDQPPFLYSHTPTPAFSSFEHAVSLCLRLGQHPGALPKISRHSLSAVDRAVDNIRSKSLLATFRHESVPSFDGASLSAYVGGVPGKQPLFLASACGMPVELSERWLRHLAEDHYVITWESRGLNGEVADFDTLGWDVSSQAKDLIAIMDHFNVEHGHVMGFCGGAVIALMAAATWPNRVSSLSLWHGDFELGDSSPKTVHQRDVKNLMLMVGKSRAQAVSLQKLFHQPSVLKRMRPDLAHLILYPYATGELLYRYGRLNGSIMDTDVESLLDRVTQPTLIVTSDDDVTAHPAGSMYVAKRLSNAMLHVEQHGDHLSLFDASPLLTSLASRYLKKNSGPRT